MIEYAIKHPDKLGIALLEHVEMLIVIMLISIVVTVLLTILALTSETISRLLIYIFRFFIQFPAWPFSQS